MSRIKYDERMKNYLLGDNLRCGLGERSLEYGSCGSYCCRHCYARCFCEYVCQHSFTSKCEYEKEKIS